MKVLVALAGLALWLAAGLLLVLGLVTRSTACPAPAGDGSWFLPSRWAWVPPGWSCDYRAVGGGLERPGAGLLLFAVLVVGLPVAYLVLRCRQARVEAAA